MSRKYADNTIKLMESILLAGMAIDRENVRARLESLAISVRDNRFDADDCFELEEIFKHGVKSMLDALDDDDFNDLVNICLREIGSRSRVIEIDRGGSSKDKEVKYRSAVAEFIKFLKNNSYGVIADFDRFKPIYEKFVQINEDIDTLVKEDLLGFFKVFQEYRDDNSKKGRR